MVSPVIASPSQVRTLALVGAPGVGKTTLAEALLHAAGEIGAPGSIERGSTVGDHDPLARRVGHSLATSVMHLHHADTRIHLVDTPGSPDFLGQTLPALEAVDTVAVVVQAATGVDPAAVRLMDQAARRGLDRLIIVNRLDQAGAEVPALLAQLREAFGRECLPVNLPADGGRRVVDCFFRRDGDSDLGPVDAAHRALIEQVVEVNADWVERYLADGDVEAGELHAPLEQALREGHLIPVCFTSAKHGTGVPELLDVIVRLLPQPGEANPPRFVRGDGDAARPVAVAADPSRPVLAQVWRIAHDAYLGRLALVRVHQGTLVRDGLLHAGAARRPVRLAHLYLLQGRTAVEVQRVLPGEVCALAKVDDLALDSVLHDAADDMPPRGLPLDLPAPVHGLAIRPRRPGDEQRLAELLARLAAEDRGLRIDHTADTHELVVHGLGELHLRLLLERLREVHHFEVDTRAPRVAYRETVTASALGQHRHKKQSGGAGQFGEVLLRVEPLPRGAGFQFADEVKGGAIPAALIPAVEKGVREAMARGVIAGHPVVDVKVTVLDGKHHSVDSKEVAFVTAGRKAFAVAVREARPIVLEPLVRLEITAPEASIGDITGDLAARRGQVSRASGGQVQALVPQAELASYSSRLNALTAGQGRFTLALSHHEPVPPSVQAQLLQHRDLDDD